jgi:4-hydroxy-tetrahydrodipicolinate synthase
VILYNVVPWTYLSATLLVRILSEVDGVIGVKQSAGDLKLLADLLLQTEEAGIRDRVRIFTAVDALPYPSFLLGSDGAVAAMLTAAPEACVALWNAVRQGEQVTGLRLHKQFLRLWRAIEAPNLPANVRVAMSLSGRDGGCPRAPMPASSPEQQQRIREAVR